MHGTKFYKKLGIKHMSSKQVIKQKPSLRNNVGGLPHGVFQKYTKILRIQKYSVLSDSPPHYYRE